MSEFLAQQGSHTHRGGLGQFPGVKPLKTPVIQRWGWESRDGVKATPDLEVLVIDGLMGIVTNNLGGGFKYFLFSPLLGEMIQFD